MERIMKKKHLAFFLFAALMIGCSSPAENTNSPGGTGRLATITNSNASANVASPSPVAQSGTPLATQQPNAPAAHPTDKPAKPDPNGPKLVVKDKELDFGKQPQDVTLTRTISIKNAGKSELQIQSVEPS